MTADPLCGNNRHGTPSLLRLKMISDAHRCIFVHIPKNGGSSLETIIWPGPRTKADLWMGFVSKYRNKYQTGGLQHLLASQIRQEVGDDKFSSYYKFSMVRNPFDRIVSQFTYMRKRQDLREYIGLKKIDSFSRYLSLITEHEHVQWTEQIKFLYDSEGLLLVDFVGRFENYQKDATVILQALGLGDVQIPHLKRSKRDGDYRSYYGPGDRAKVAKMFERDIDLFEYTF
jgi:hypothetical protein